MMRTLLLMVFVGGCSAGVLVGPNDSEEDEPRQTLASKSKCSGGTPFGWHYCQEDCKCGQWQGDCDNDDECEAGLTCAENVGLDFDAKKSIDVCVPEGWQRQANDHTLKSATMYSDKQVFLVSDRSWQAVLTMVPAAIWHQDGVLHKKPLLAFHEEVAEDTLQLTDEMLKIFAGYNDVSVTLQGPELRVGQTKTFTLELVNSAAEERDVVVTMSNDGLFSLKSDNEIEIIDQGTQWLIRASGGYSLSLEAGTTKTFKVQVTLDRIPGGGFDAFSIVHFLEQYQAQKVSVVGDLPEDLEGAIAKQGYEIGTAPPAKLHWEAHTHLVVVPEDYGSALVGAVYASLIDAPLVIEGFNDSGKDNGRTVVCVGKVAKKARCDEQHTIAELQKKYVSETGTNKIVLTNPTLGMHLSGEKTDTTTGAVFARLFENTSLGAAILASAKKELLVLTTDTTIDAVDAQLDAAIAATGIAPKYLTIMASPLEIQQTVDVEQHGKVYKRSVDNAVYGDLDGDENGMVELRTGRIYGFSTSDVTAYLARVLFYEELPRSKKVLLVGQGVSNDEDIERFAGWFSGKGFETTFRTYADPAEPADYEGVGLIYNGAHGSPFGSVFGADEMPLLTNALILEASCLTCAFDKMNFNYEWLFCTEEIRKGAIGVIASVETAGFDWTFNRLIRALDSDLGTMNKTYQNIMHARARWYHIHLSKEDMSTATFQKGDIKALLGDPTFNPQLGKAPLFPSRKVSIEQSEDQLDINISFPSYTLEDGAKVLLEGIDSHLPQPKYPHAFLRVGPLTLPAGELEVASPDVEDVFYDGILMTAVHEDLDGTYIYLAIEKSLADNPTDTLVWNDLAVTITGQPSQ